MRQHLAKEFCFGGDFDVVNNWHAPQKHPLWTIPDGFAWPFSHTHTHTHVGIPKGPEDWFANGESERQ